MTWRRYLEPRDTGAAALTTSVLGAATAMMALVYEIAARARGENVGSGTTLVLLAGLVVVAVGGWVLRRMLPTWVWTLVPYSALAAIVVMNLTTVDASAGAQLVLLFPVVYAGALLRQALVWSVAAAAVGAEAAVVFALLPAERALSDLAYFALTTAAVTAVLARSYRQQDLLVAQLRRLADVDALTGLRTRRGLQDSLGGTALPATGRGTGLVLIDIDRFKQINDSHGHPVGDAALVHVAGVVVDVAGSADTVVRLGGDELAVLVADCDLGDIADLAEAFLVAVRGYPFTEGGRTIPVTISVGAAHSLATTAAVGRAPDLADVYTAADAALYQAKQRGRDRSVVAGADPGAPAGTDLAAVRGASGAGASRRLGA